MQLNSTPSSGFIEGLTAEEKSKLAAIVRELEVDLKMLPSLSHHVLEYAA
uniref:Uncharacterized protein n=1 Tax=Parascaris equorum TaxID=6256 RepID=A0A914S482_PAREQ